MALLKFGEISVVTYLLAVLGISAISLALFVCDSLYRKRHIIKFSRNFNGHTFYPIVGNGFHLMGKNIFVAVLDIIKKYGLPCNLWIGHHYNYVTCDANEIKVIFSNPNTFDKSPIYETFNLIFTTKTLLFAPLEMWKMNRKFYSKSFTQPILNTFVQIFYAKSEVLLKVLKDSDNKNKFEVFEKYATDSFCASIIGVDYDIQQQEYVEFVDMLGKLQEIGGKRMSECYYYPTKIWLNMPAGIRAKALRTKFQSSVQQILTEKRRLFKETRPEFSTDSSLPFLDAMLEANIDDEHIFNELFLFIMAATDTSGYTLAYTITLLGMHPEIQEKVYQEVISIVGHDRPIYQDDLPNLKYTERAILEAMRILPVTPLLGRMATADVDLGNKVVPEGTSLLISVFHLHRNEKYWPDPLKYDPDRFLPEEVAKREPSTYIPFAGGPRNCIGKTYATMLMKTSVANVVRNYKIFSKYKSVTELKLVSCVTMKTEDHLDCRFRPRKHE